MFSASQLRESQDPLALRKQRTRHIDLWSSQNLEMRNFCRERIALSLENLLYRKSINILLLFKNARWVKLAQPAKPTFSIPTLLMGSCGRRRLYTIKQGFFADTLYVKISILSSNAIKFQV